MHPYYCKVQGSIHQGDEIFSPDSRGRQCLPCCLVFLVKAVQKRICTNMWNVNNMNEILFAGDKLYKYAKKNPRHIMTIWSHVICHLIFHLTTSIITGK